MSKILVISLLLFLSYMQVMHFFFDYYAIKPGSFLCEGRNINLLNNTNQDLKLRFFLKNVKNSNIRKTAIYHLEYYEYFTDLSKNDSLFVSISLAHEHDFLISVYNEDTYLGNIEYDIDDFGNKIIIDNHQLNSLNKSELPSPNKYALLFYLFLFWLYIKSIRFKGLAFRILSLTTTPVQVLNIYHSYNILVLLFY